jgi:hypothetical protein
VVGEVGSLQISLGEVRVDLLEARRARSKGVEFVLVLAVVGDELGVRRARNDVLLTWKRKRFKPNIPIRITGIKRNAGPVERNELTQ